MMSLDDFPSILKSDEKLRESSITIQWLYFSVNSTCFIVYCILLGIILAKLKRTNLETRTKNMMTVYVLTFLRKNFDIFIL